MRVADLLIQCLENEGVRYIFGVPGEETLDINDALRDSSIEFVSVRHEQGAAFMADAYGRLTGKAGVCLATLGPGATNLITGIVDANLDRAPLVAITGQADLRRIHQEYHQYIDVNSVFRPFTKWTASIASPEPVVEVVRKAFKLAEAEPPGATHIELPENIAAMIVADDMQRRPLLNTPRDCSHPPIAPQELLQQAAEILEQAKSPVMLVGNGVVRGRASAAVQQLAETLNVPVVNTFMGKGILSFQHPLSLYTIGLQVRDHIACGIDGSDVIVAIGYDYVEYGPEYWNADRDKTIIHIAATPAEVDSHYVPAVEIVGDINRIVSRLAAMTFHAKEFSRFQDVQTRILDEYRASKDDTHFPIKPQKALYQLRQVLVPEDIVISDVGAHKIWVARMFPAYRPNTVLISNGFAAMGFGLPAAIAAKLVHPNRTVVTISGDGGFMMNVQELETAVRLNIAVVVVVFNDNGYGLIRWKQENRYNATTGVDFQNPDFVALAHSFGAEGFRLERTEDFPMLLRKAIACQKPVVIDCPVDYRENLKLTKRLEVLDCPVNF
ncbi:MAG: acetolactate synthase large subunit [Cyanobacteria bacterium P01_F01_bin.33]